MSFDFSKQRVLITGGTSGIGFAVAQAFADAGANVTATGLTDKEVAAAAVATNEFCFGSSMCAIRRL